MNDLEKRFAAARRQAIATDYAHLNPRQLEGVLTTEGPLLLLAGAGSGKTTCALQRLAALAKAGKEPILLIPEQDSFENERRLLEQLPPPEEAIRKFL